MNYLITVYRNRVNAEAAYAVLEKYCLPRENISILGKGYKKTDEYGVIKPNRQEKVYLRTFAFYLIPIGLIAGLSFNLLTNIEIFFGSIILSRTTEILLAGITGLLLALLVNNIFKEEDDSCLYRNRLNAGKYLIMVQGNQELIEKATVILRNFEVEDI